jgi:hypothetical protein
MNAEITWEEIKQYLWKYVGVSWTVPKKGRTYICFKWPVAAGVGAALLLLGLWWG